jgi:hypothetical protein
MKILKYLSLLFLLFLLAFIVFVATQPATYQITKQKEISTPTPFVFEYVNDFLNWNDWQQSNTDENIKYTEDEASKLFDYHERTGMLPQDMTSEEYDEIMSYYNIKRDNWDDDTDPAGGSGIHSYI